MSLQIRHMYALNASYMSCLCIPRSKGKHGESIRSNREDMRATDDGRKENRRWISPPRRLPSLWADKPSRIQHAEIAL